jgi:hypothetical protein
MFTCRAAREVPAPSGTGLTLKTFKILVLSAAALVAAVLVFTLLTLPPAQLVLERAAWAPPGASTVVRGAYHAHTTRSDGTGTPDEVADAAARAGLQFVIFTDHGNGLRIPDAPRYRSGVLCIDAIEISTDAGHFVALGLGAAPYPLGGEARDVVEDVARLGGFGIIAHPESAKPSLRWGDWSVPVGAIEWLNADSEWRGDSVSHLAHELLTYLFRGPESIAAIFTRPTAALARWDALAKHGRVVGLAAADAHARLGFRRETDPAPGVGFNGLPSYEAVFRTFATRVEIDRPWSGDATADAAALLSAIRAGHTYAAVDALAGPVAFEFNGRSGDRIASEGDTLPAGGVIVFTARVSRAPRSTLVLLRDGRVVAQTAGARLEKAVDGDAGAYRVEARLADVAVPWIASNPIYVGGPLEPVVPRDPGVPTHVVAIEADVSAWRVEKEQHSRGTVEQTPGAPGALDFHYELGGGPRANPYVAFVRSVSGVAGFDRLSFRARADRPMRLSLQLRKPGATEGERWQRSIYLDQTPRDVTVLLDDLRPIGPTSGRSLPLAAVDTLLLVVDTTNALPGTSRTIRFENLRLEGK